MSAPAVLMTLAAICAVWATVSGMLLTRYLDQRGLVTPFPLLRLYFFRNLGRYRELTRSQTGKTGPLYYSYIVPINAALVLALFAIVFYLRGT